MRLKYREIFRAVVPFCLLAWGGLLFATDSLSPDEVIPFNSKPDTVDTTSESTEAILRGATDDEAGTTAEDTVRDAAGEPAVGPVDDHDLDVIENVVDQNIVYDFYGHESVELRDDQFVGPPKPEVTGNTAPKVKKSRPPIAANINLSEPAELLPEIGGIEIGSIAPPIEPTLAVYEQEPLLLLGVEVAPGTSTRLAWSSDQTFDGIEVPTPVLVVNGANQGPVLCVTAAIHGDELNGIEVVRRVLYDLEPEKLSGAVIGVPIVNLQGFRRASRYLPDRRDLNRYFPGSSTGSAASRLAHSFFTEIISQCDALVDLHTGSFQRTNLPQLRADLKNPKIVELTKGFGSTVVLHSRGASGTLRRAAADAGIPTVALEAGEPARVQDDAVTHSTKGVMTLLNELGMYSRTTTWGNREPVYYRSKWVRANSGGVLFSRIDLGDRVKKGDLLGTVTDPITNVRTELRASVKGRVLGMALDQFVMPGFAAYRIGIESSESDILTPADIQMSSSTPGFDLYDDDDSAESPPLTDRDAENAYGTYDSAEGDIDPFDDFDDESGYLEARENIEDSE